MYYREKVANVVEEYEEEMSNLMQKIIKEQEINEQSENEIIQLRIELDNIRRQTGTNKNYYLLMRLNIYSNKTSTSFKFMSCHVNFSQVNMMT